jgi:polyvinyl alcohol dehydrogenase (cytochrome)
MNSGRKNREGKPFLTLLVLIIGLLCGVEPLPGQTRAGFLLYEKYCATCHGTAANAGKLPDELKMRQMTSEAIYEALTKPPHTTLPPGDEAKKRIAGHLGERKVGVAQIADARLMLDQCPVNSPLGDLAASPIWNGWGVDISNTRFQPAREAGLSADQVPRLKLKWAFGLPAAEEVYSQPTVAGGRVFFGADTGAVYSVDAASGCVYWSFQADAAVRTAISIKPVKKSESTTYGVYFGDLKANVYMLEAATGKLIWKTKVDDHPLARITGAPTLYQDRLYVPVSSLEERAGGTSTVYPCCTFRGSVLALDANTGSTLWKTYVIPEAPKPTRKTSKGIQQWGPAGGSVWSSPTLDPEHHAIYIGTGDSYTEPAPKTTDAIMALDMNTGKVLWSVQDTGNDAWLSGCEGSKVSENCPKDMGPDFDFGSSPILRTLPDGRRILVCGQKSGMVWAHDPDRDGAVVWKAQLVEKLALGMITFGGAADDQNAYFGLRTGGVAAVRLVNGEKKWFTPLTGPPVPSSGGDTGVPAATGETAAITAIPGVVFSGGWDGVLRALSTEDGHLLWQYNTAREFDTVNHVAAKGGSMGAPGATVAGGTVFVGSGYVFGAGTPGNVMLAFSVQ